VHDILFPTLGNELEQEITLKDAVEIMEEDLINFL
jgi:hypothetical protein